MVPFVGPGVDAARCQPGEVVCLNYRRPGDAQEADSASRPLRLLQWNIERGYQLDAVIAQLRSVDADVISLQELDAGNARSAFRDCAAEIAAALAMDCLFACEFRELPSPLRDARSAGGGVHGNALLSRYGFARHRLVEHSHHPVDWNAAPEQQAHVLAAREPRAGRRLSLAAEVDTPQLGRLTVYCCHLEVFCGVLGRVWQFSDILADARRVQQQAAAAHVAAALAAEQQQQQQAAVQAAGGEQQVQAVQGAGGQQVVVNEPAAAAAAAAPSPALRAQPCRQAILGDLNTMGHSVARLSPHYCCDALRWRSLGMSEAAWWQRHVLAVTEPAAVNRYLVRQGLPLPVAAAAVNPGFADPFDVDADVTLDNPAYRLGPLHLMAGKLDWALLRGLRVVRKAMGNDDYAASDHRWLLVEVVGA